MKLANWIRAIWFVCILTFITACKGENVKPKVDEISNCIGTEESYDANSKGSITRIYLSTGRFWDYNGKYKCVCGKLQFVGQYECKEEPKYDKPSDVPECLGFIYTPGIGFQESYTKIFTNGGNYALEGHWQCVDKWSGSAWVGKLQYAGSPNERIQP